MGKPKLTDIKNWDDMPLMMTVEQVSNYLGIGINVVYDWFNDKTFPAITNGTKKVEKYNLRIWLDTKYGKYVYKNKADEMLLDKIKKIINKNCDDLTEERERNI